MMMQLITRKDCTVALASSSLFVAVGLVAFLWVDEKWLGLAILGFTALFASMVPVSLAKLLEIKRREEEMIEDHPEVVRTFAIAKLEFVLYGFGALLGSLFFYTPRLTGIAEPALSALMAWTGTALILFGLLMPLVFLLRPRMLTLSPQGIDYGPSKRSLVPWRDIVSVEQGKGWSFGSIYLQISGQQDKPFVIKSHYVGTISPVILNAIKLRLKAFGEQRQ